MIKIVLLPFAMMLFLFTACKCQTSISSNSHNSTSIDLEKWARATINIECESGDDITFKKLDSLEKNGIITKDQSDSMKRIAFSFPPRESGTAIFLKYNDQHFLISARHVLLDYQSTDSNALARKIFLVENEGTSRNDPTGITISGVRGKVIVIDYDKDAEITFLWSFDLLGWQSPDSLGYRKASYIFSSIDDDIAILCLEEGAYGQQFIKTLYKRGYSPISLSDINTSFDVKEGQKITSIGFPEEVLGTIKKPSENLVFESDLISIPMVTEGVIINKNPKRNSFDADIFVYHGNSGGPAICNNKLVGIVHGPTFQPLHLKSGGKLSYYVLKYSNFRKSSLITPLLKQLINKRVKGFSSYEIKRRY